jgi:heme-degrading monooxygenase HmoA
LSKPIDDNLTYISTSADLITLVNVFTVEPANQERLARLLQEATEHAIKHLLGFISANIHKSLDGTRVVNYAQWRTEEDFEAMFRNPEASKHIQEAYKIAQVDPHLYKVESVHHI